MEFEVVFLILFAVASGVALLANHLKIPYTVALVVAGVILGAFHAVQAPHLTRDLLYTLILPGLLFEAAFHLDFSEFWENRLAIHSLAILGVVAAILVTAAILTAVARTTELLPGATFGEGLVFGAILAATDPIAVVALFKRLGAPRRLSVLVEGESLLNDGTAVVLFTIVLAALSGGQVHAVALAGEFARVVGLGVAAGGVLGYLASRIIQHVDDPMIEITLTTIAAYGSFVVAENVSGSGVIATVTAGMLCGNYAARTGMGPSTRIAVETFWEYIAFALNSIVFLLIGFEVRPRELLAYWKPILLTYAAMTIARAVVVGGVAGALRKTRERISLRWTAAMVWAGLRGALAMVLVLGLPHTFRHREALIATVFGVVLLSILVQGLSMTKILSWLGLATSSDARREFEIRRGELLATRAALSELDRMEQEVAAPASVLKRIRSRYERRSQSAEEELGSFSGEREDLVSEQARSARRRLLRLEKSRILEAHRSGQLGDAAFQKLAADVDARLVRVEQGEPEDEEEEKQQEEAEGAEMSGAGEAAEEPGRAGPESGSGED